jgi:hypothetical protein
VGIKYFFVVQIIPKSIKSSPTTKTITNFFISLLNNTFAKADYFSLFKIIKHSKHGVFWKNAQGMQVGQGPITK